MRKQPLAAATVALALALALPLTPVAMGSGASTPKLTGTVGPGFAIKLTRGGKPVKKLEAGTYTFVITDRSPMHSYGLDGPRGFAKDFTSVSFTGTKTFTLRLGAGIYKYYCQPHESSMFGNFTVS